jgi:hypothetical protein
VDIIDDLRNLEAPGHTDTRLKLFWTMLDRMEFSAAADQIERGDNAYGRALNDLWTHFAKEGSTGTASTIFVFARDHGYNVGPLSCRQCGAKTAERHKVQCEYCHGG